ncbi:MAG TPA: ribosome recycling factor [Dehalococcoidia bacterium]|nr:ribosome recycling factor [Dehalococcoidia bacterium]
MIQDVMATAKDHMNKTVEATRRELASIRSGRASPGLVEHVRVELHGVPTPITHMATVNAPEARLLTIQPWDRSTLGLIEKAILKSDLGLNPSNDGAMIRLPIPPLNEQRRKELVKMVHARVEEGRVAVRNIRRDASDGIKKLERNKEISADEARRVQDQLQKLTDGSVGEVDKLGQQKEQELMEV